MPLAFMIVGTPRSGTTFVQRLACELEGVVMPPETHFLSRFLRNGARPLPLEGDELRQALQSFLDLPTSRALDLDPAAVSERLGGRCDSYLELFGAVTRELAGPGPILGEKTPEHLLWWRRLTTGIPGLRLVCVIRDPRGVFASHRDVPWGIRSPIELAEQWTEDVSQIEEAARSLGPGRCRVLRFEEIVTDPRCGRTQVADLLQTRPAREPDTGAIVAGWEWWKERAVRRVDPRKAWDWRERLDPETAGDIAALCREPLLRLGAPDVPSSSEAERRIRMLDPAGERQRVRARLRERRRWVEGFPLTLSG